MTLGYSGIESNHVTSAANAPGQALAQGSLQAGKPTKEVDAMLSHMTHVHAAENCPAHNPDSLRTLTGFLQSAEGKGVRGP